MTKSATLDPDTLAAELALIELVRASEDPQARLELLDEHRARYPSGTMAAERDVLRAIALCELGRLDAAREQAEQFLQAHPRSPHRSHLRSGCPQLELDEP